MDDFAYEAIGKLNTTIEEGTTQDDIPKEQVLLIGQYELFPEWHAWEKNIKWRQILYIIMDIVQSVRNKQH